ncbi:MAG: aminomethyl-transferring glycine dehydrogenase subunit GcvPB [Elusimicrobia bacterium]|jgi:glycine dehydrogenase subunit 2|nr:aminomethyl-transferring glycine dehydrogenase subunit GcvPB [Elusimicrobiota bacterium]
MELIFEKSAEKSAEKSEGKSEEKASDSFSFHKSVKSGKAARPVKSDKNLLGEKHLRKTPAELPLLAEGTVVRHYTRLSEKNFCIDKNFYPLGSCTMKYNPALNEKIAADKRFRDMHPMLGLLKSGAKYAAGSLKILFELQNTLSEITGMAATTLQPLAGAHGEFSGLLIAKAYHKNKGNNKNHIIVPDESHGTNPASAARAGYKVVTVPTDKSGRMDIEIFRKRLSEETAAVILTSPNTLGVFDPRIKEICRMAREKDALMYYDGANMNALVGRVKPKDAGFDIAHLNLHKTFGAPHGGGGPGSGPLSVRAGLEKFLPGRQVAKDTNGNYCFAKKAQNSIGERGPFYGNFSVLLKSYIYIKLLGIDGLKDVSEKAVLNANYIRAKLKDYYDVAGDGLSMHECVFSPKSSSKSSFENSVKDKNMRGTAMDIAKFLIDKDIHPPTVYFPLIVKEAIMTEPTETESLSTLDYFIDAMIKAADMLKKDPHSLGKYPFKTELGRLDEVEAARNPDVNFCPKKSCPEKSSSEKSYPKKFSPKKIYPEK